MASWRLSALDVWWTVVALSSTCLLPQWVWAKQPQFNNTPYAATLNERSGSAQLLALPCTDEDNDPTIVDLSARDPVSPSSPCGSCFRVLTCDPPDTGYCLFYTDGVDKLDANRVQRYTITVECTDGKAGVSVTETVDLRIRQNSPPTFIPSRFVDTVTVPDTKNVKAGTVIEDVDAVDVDSDNIVFSMVTDPASDNFEIGAGDGIIRAKNDLISECTNSISFYVSITDNINPTGQPLAIHATLEGSNQRPDLTNLDVTVHVPEDKGKSIIYTAVATDDDSVKKLTYTYTAVPSANAAYFTMNGEDLRVAAALDYEAASMRDTDFTIVASDGSCSSEPGKVRVTITDVNEPPILQPADKAYWVYEGQTLLSLDGSPLNIDWDVIDEDFVDAHTYQIIDGNAPTGMFSIDYKTGQITVNTDYELDQNVMPDTQTVEVQVTDKGGLTSRTTVQLHFRDKNDKYPYILAGDFSFTVCEDKRIGATLGTLKCKDDDLETPNNEVYITATGSGLTVLTDGSIIMTSRPPLGSTHFVTALCHDRGVFPGPLTSITPVPISVTTVECPTTPAPTQAPTAAPKTTMTTMTTTTVMTTPSPTDGGDNGVSWMEENMWWVVLASLLGMALLSLLLYMCYIYCSGYCLRCCREPWCVGRLKRKRNLWMCRRRPTRHRRIESTPRAITPVETPPPQVKPRAVIPVETPPPPEVTVGPPYLYDFWKERYPDDDYQDSPNRKARPRPVTARTAELNGTGNAADRETPGGVSPPSKKKTRCCNIL